MKRSPLQAVRITAVVLAISIGFAGYRWGEQSARSLPVTVSFQVAGDSMAPTLLHDSVCQILPNQRPLRIGDVVAIRWEGKTRVKRVAALGGDTVDVREGRLLVNGLRLEDLIAGRSKRDRGKNPFLEPARVPVSSSPADWKAPVPDSNWIRYSHRNPHQAGRNTPVMDDYPMNHSVRRVLNPVDRLVVKSSKKCLVVFFREDNWVVTETVNGVARCGDVRDTEEDLSMVVDANELQLDAAHPIAIKLRADETQQYQLDVLREIEYRDDDPSGVVSYPITLNPDEVFVVGDNVPVSVDSRQIGTLKTSAIIGTVKSPVVPD